MIVRRRAERNATEVNDGVESYSELVFASRQKPLRAREIHSTISNVARRYDRDLAINTAQTVRILCHPTSAALRT